MAKAKESKETTQPQTAQQSEAQPNQTQQPQSMQNTAQGGGRQGIARRESSAPSLFSASPFAFMRRCTEDMDRLFEEFGMGRGLMPNFFGRELAPRRPESSGVFSQAIWSPQVEVFKRGDQLVIRADLPGLNKDDVHLDLTDDALTIEGERRFEHEENQGGVYRSERSYGSFRRQIPLPEGVNAENATATFRDGVLEVTMPMPEPRRASRRIEIQDAPQSETNQQANAQATGQNR